jgi:hypothetical protein
MIGDVPVGTQGYRLGLFPEAPQTSGANVFGVLRHMEVEVRNHMTAYVPPDPHAVDEAAIDALIAWSLDPNVMTLAEADRLHAQAWGDDDGE